MAVNIVQGVDNVIDLPGRSMPLVAVVDNGRIYFDLTSGKFRVSEDGGAYVDLVGGGGGGGTLASVRTTGNTTGGTDISVSSGDAIDGAAALPIGTTTATSVTIGRSGGTVSIEGGTTTVTGNLTVSGTTTTVNSTNLTIADQVILIASQNPVTAPQVRSAYAIERGTTGDDLVFYMNTSPQRVEIGFFDTNEGADAPTGALSTLSDLRVEDLTLSGTSITADAGLAINGTGANSVTIGAGGSTRLTVLSTGLVGIGVTPTSTLHSGGTIAWATTSVSGPAVTVDGTATVWLIDASGGVTTANLPTAVGIAGRVYYLKKTDSSANAVTVDGSTTETLDGALTQDLVAQYESITIVSDGSNWHIV